MSVGALKVPVYCDVPGCDQCETFSLEMSECGWEIRSLNTQIENAGWVVIGSEHTCPDCHREYKRQAREKASNYHPQACCATCCYSHHNYSSDIYNMWCNLYGKEINGTFVCNDYERNQR